MAMPLDSHHPATGRGLALLLEDDPAARRLLGEVLTALGFAVHFARCADEVLECLASERVDIVFLATAAASGARAAAVARHIQALSENAFVPLIFIGAPADERLMLECIAAGGADFLVKPLSPSLLRARVQAAERLRDLQRAIAVSGKPLTELIERDRQELLLAERIFRGAIGNRNAETDQIQTFQRSATTFNGDLLLTQRLPDGGLRALLGDITGHGLGATIGALPVAEAFHAMSIKGVDDASVLREINRKLHGLLTSDRFMAAFMVSLSGDGHQLSWWNGGMPSGWLRTRDGLVELASHTVPLGVLAELPAEDAPRPQRVEPGDAVLLLTDGLIAALDHEGMAFGDDRLAQALSEWLHGESVLASVREAVLGHCGDRALPDDIALLELRVAPGLPAAAKPAPARSGAWSWSFEMARAQMPRSRSLGSLLRPLGLLDGLERQAAVLERILSLLCDVPALNGVQGQGERLAPLDRSRSAAEPLRLDIAFSPLPEGGRLWVTLSLVTAPSADGMGGVMDAAATAATGDALKRLEAFCESVELQEDGRAVRVVYRW